MKAKEKEGPSDLSNTSETVGSTHATRSAKTPSLHTLRAWLRFTHSKMTATQRRSLYIQRPLGAPDFFRQSKRRGRYSCHGRSVEVDEDAVENDLRWAAANADHYLIPLDHPDYPAALKEIYDPPWVLYVKGNPACLQTQFIAIVGSRCPSAGGRINAAAFAYTLGTAGWGIISGLAVGIDAAAHQGTLRAGAITVAVLGTGPDQVYPRRHRALALEIAQHGALVTEFPPGTPPKRHHFPLRNRIISGMSRSVLVVEAGIRSGSLITARLAADQGREVCAVPGSIHSPNARGCHRLIQQGAKLVESAQDIERELDYCTTNPDLGRGTKGEEVLHEFGGLLSHLGHDPVTVDELIGRSGLTAEAVSSMLLKMEVRGLVATLPGGRYQRLGT